jgi:hypothetical protein
MNQASKSGLEGGLRRLLWLIIAIFIFLALIPFVGMMLFDAFARVRGPISWKDPLCFLALISGPVLLWIALAAMYFRAPRELRDIYFGQMAGRYSGTYDLRGVFQFFSGYRKRFGIDAWSWIALMSIPWTIVVIVALGLAFSGHRP